MTGDPHWAAKNSHVTKTAQGALSRERILDAAVELIAERGYSATSVDALCKKAGIVKFPADLKGIKLRMPNTETWLDVGRALGANPTPLGFGEVYMGLKTGTIDGQDNPIPTSYNEKFLEVTKYVVLTDHVIGYVTPVINEKLWQEMPDTYRAFIKQAMRVARFWMNERVLASTSGGSSFAPVPQGVHVGRCYRVIDLGTQTSEFQGKQKKARKVMLAWALFGEDEEGVPLKMDDGRPLSISKRYTLSLSEKASLRADLEAWRGRAFTEDEMAGFDLKHLSSESMR